MIPEFRRAFPRAPISFDAAQLDPDWQGIPLVHPGYPKKCREMGERVKVRSEVVLKNFGPPESGDLRIRVRRYRFVPELLGIAINDRVYVGLAGLETLAVDFGRPWLRAGPEGGPLGVHLQERFDVAWKLLDSNSSLFFEAG